MIASPTEDKTCRMCGHADRSNLNIFQPRQIYKKIIALYPIVLYKSDPLPKNICLKCYGSTLKRYDEYIRISKIQTKWINNVRNNQPNNPYIKILDKIEETNAKLIENIRKIGDESLDDSFSVIKHSRNLFPEDILLNKNSQNVTIKTEKSNFFQRFANPSSNRVLLSHLKGENITNANINSNGYNKSLNCGHNNMDNTNFPKNKCRYCCKLLPSQKFLAFHQMKFHLGLSVYKSFTRKVLPKRLRCGQPIKINNKTCLRCNNCWKCFGNYESILNHWQNKRCEFYCLICGKEFPNNPSPLKKHLRVEHLLDCNSYKDLITKSISLIPSKTSQQNRKLFQHIKSEESSPSSLDFRKQTFEFININDKRKIPVLKLKRKTNSEKEEFDIKVEDISNSPPYGRSPSDIDMNISGDMNEEAVEKPLLRVKNITELQCNPKIEEEDDADEEFVSLDEFKLNTINIESNSPRSIKENFCEEIE